MTAPVHARMSMFLEERKLEGKKSMFSPALLSDSLEKMRTDFLDILESGGIFEIVESFKDLTEEKKAFLNVCAEWYSGSAGYR